MSIRNRLGISASLLLVGVACTRASSPTADGAPAPAESAAPLAGAEAESLVSPPTADPSGDPRPETGSNEPALESGASAPSDEPLPMPVGTKVLHIGDSFAGALGRPLGDLFEGAGMRSVLKHTDSSYLTDWAWDGKLQQYIWKYNPDLVIVTLGANELEIVDPNQREKTVKKIISVIGPRPCVWVAIPLWEGPKNGLLEVIREHVSPCVYMDTNALLDTTKMDRIQDGIHPTSEARRNWAAFVFDWLKAQRKPTPEKPWTLRP